MEEINLLFWVEFSKCNILRFLTDWQSWDRLMSDLCKKLLNLKTTGKVIECQRDRLGALSPMEIFRVMLINV